MLEGIIRDSMTKQATKTLRREGYLIANIYGKGLENISAAFKKNEFIKFLKNKEMTQEEFFHTFNTLYEANKQIIISSDRLPREIETLEDRLRSRFESGLLADIQSPDLETRIAILRKKAESENISIPHDVISLVASSIDTNIREIEGAYTKIVAYASLMGSPITIDLAKKILDAMGTSTKNKQITFDDIIQVTSDYFKIKEL